jgi:hypothetical protein
VKFTLSPLEKTAMFWDNMRVHSACLVQFWFATVLSLSCSTFQKNTVRQKEYIKILSSNIGGKLEKRFLEEPCSNEIFSGMLMMR